jgi:FkbM family methyltransferase
MSFLKSAGAGLRGLQASCLRAVRGALQRLGVSVVKSITLTALVHDSHELIRLRDFHRFLNGVYPVMMPRALDLISSSKGQIFQDIFVLLALDEKSGGFFVEFGATDGVTGSNTWLLEKRFGWRGILAEPATVWHPRLREARGCVISDLCVWRESGHRLIFNEAPDAGFSTLEAFSDSDSHAPQRVAGKRYEVETISLNDLLQSSRAPTIIDYLSIDTEGSEFDILNSFDFDRWDVSIITVEHNTDFAKRSAILKLLTSHGYCNVLTSLSQYDDWYVKEALLPNVKAKFLGAETLLH